jgi:cellulose synthase/poly-beta-1,6-N-acetylglucosamine synthase-like glycosyltransferase
MITNILNIVNIVFGAIFVLCYSYQLVFIVISLVKKPKIYPETSERFRYAVLVSARNEENVIDQLIGSLKDQDYPSELVDVYVIADNCTDNTAAVARECGAIVIERHNTELVGKGYAISALLDHIRDTVGFDAYDGYFVFDADNILEKNYVSEMNKSFAAGERLVTSYRNSKNFGENWITQGYSVWFLREARQLNGVRNLLGTTSEIKGTGFLVHKDIIKRQGGWVQHLLIEDVQFTIEKVLEGERVAYCDTAIFYDEQPTDLVTSWWQRLRWCRGYVQILGKYTGKLLGAFFRGRGFSNYDMLMAMAPAFFISLAMVAVNVLGLVLTLIFEPSSFLMSLMSALMSGVGAYFLFALVSVFTVITERKRIHATVGQRICAALTFPIFMATYIPIAGAALFMKPEWKQIQHKRADESDAAKKEKEFEAIEK